MAAKGVQCQSLFRQPSEMAKAMRKEQEVFDELASLCATPGYAHVIAFFCFRDHFVRYGDELKDGDYSKLYSRDRLIRTELSTLIGLMARAPIDLSVPPPHDFQTFIDRTESLMHEMHGVTGQPFAEALKVSLAERQKLPAAERTATPADPFDTAEVMREPIFYSAESAYSFQYRDLAAERYANDAKWINENKGFSISDARQLVSAIHDSLAQSLL
jgi:hypothetical protein